MHIEISFAVRQILLRVQLLSIINTTVMSVSLYKHRSALSLLLIKYALDHEGWAVGVAALWGYY